MNLIFKYELWKLADTYDFLNDKFANFLKKILYTKKIRDIANQEEKFYKNLREHHYDLAEENIEEMIKLGCYRSPRISGMRTKLSLERIRRRIKNE